MASTMWHSGLSMRFSTADPCQSQSATPQLTALTHHRRWCMKCTAPPMMKRSTLSAPCTMQGTSWHGIKWLYCGTLVPCIRASGTCLGRAFCYCLGFITLHMESPGFHCFFSDKRVCPEGSSFPSSFCLWALSSFHFYPPQKKKKKKKQRTNKQNALPLCGQQWMFLHMELFWKDTDKSSRFNSSCCS